MTLLRHHLYGSPRPRSYTKFPPTKSDPPTHPPTYTLPSTLYTLCTLHPLSGEPLVDGRGRHQVLDCVADTLEQRNLITARPSPAQTSGGEKRVNGWWIDRKKTALYKQTHPPCLEALLDTLATGSDAFNGIFDGFWYTHTQSSSPFDLTAWMIALVRWCTVRGCGCCSTWPLLSTD